MRATEIETLPRCLDCHRTEADGPCLAGNGSTRRYEAHRYPEPPSAPTGRVRCEWCGHRLLVSRRAQDGSTVCPDPAACKARAMRGRA